MMKTLGRSLQKGIALWCIVAMGFMLYVANSPTPEPLPALPPAVGSPEELASRLNCWDDGTNKPMPSHVVYRFEGDWKIGGTKMVDAAFKNIFDNVDNGIVIHKFCE